MEKQIADVFDLAAVVIVLCVCLATGVKTTIRDYYEICNYEANYEDKTANAKYSPQSKIYGEYNGTLTQQEAVLVSQIQDYTAMSTDNIRFANNSYKKDMPDGANTGTYYDEAITSSYKEGYTTIASAIWNTIKSDNSSEGGYSYTYNYDKNRYILQQEVK